MKKRRELVEAMHLSGREVSAAAVRFHAAVAARRGLSATDEKAVDVLLREGPLSHAELGHRTGLKPASVTDLIDRLERKGLARREPHPQDGRRVMVAADAERALAEFGPLFTEWVGELESLYADYSDAELRAIADFMHRAAARQEAISERIEAG